MLNWPYIKQMQEKQMFMKRLLIGLIIKEHLEMVTIDIYKQYCLNQVLQVHQQYPLKSTGTSITNSKCNPFLHRHLKKALRQGDHEFLILPHPSFALFLALFSWYNKMLQNKVQPFFTLITCLAKTYQVTETTTSFGLVFFFFFKLLENISLHL